MRQNGSDDPTIEAMKMSGIEITRENYLNYIFQMEYQKTMAPN